MAQNSGSDKIHRTNLRMMFSFKMTYVVLCFASLLLLFIPRVSRAVTDVNDGSTLTSSELQDLVLELKGDDNRLMRWSATDYTKQKQQSVCDEHLPKALQTIETSSSDTSAQALACELATFCITDNPVQRARLGTNDYAAIVNLVASSDSHTAAMASHLIYIASFSNKQNQQGFFQAGAVLRLSLIIKNASSSKLAIMWAAAALQNLAASYCNSKGNGRCSWDWQSLDILSISEGLTITSDGSSIRQKMVADSALIKKLKNLACLGPVKGEMTDQNPYVGVNAVVGGTHDESSNIVPWAATGLLKNLALEPAGRLLIEDGDTTLKCICRMAHSPDWLEENKGGGTLHYLRPSDPCWFQDDDYENGKLCVDDRFLDKNGYTCSDYDKATDEECLATNASGTSAKTACCACGGGKPEASWSVSSSVDQAGQ
mmetsp:Transcript_14069/g.21493  ORF Transcript_14069/g.21493 Transcript_14069/m.21493 type:complete len:429 (-) Transcript_14069:141-1427(-)